MKISHSIRAATLSAAALSLHLAAGPGAAFDASHLSQVKTVHNCTACDLSSADLRGISLANAVLKGSNLEAANLGGAGLSGANLSGANLSGADPEPGRPGRDKPAGRKTGHGLPAREQTCPVPTWPARP